MDKDYFMNAGIPPPQPLQFEPIPWSGLNDQSFLNPSSSIDRFSHSESTWSSIVSAPTTSATAALSGDASTLRGLIGQLGTASFAQAASPFLGTNSISGDGANCTTPLSSILDQINIPNLGNSMPPIPPLPSLSADPGFAERAAKFSCFDSRSFNGRTSQFGPNSGELGRNTTPPLICDDKLHRISSSPSFKQDGSPPENMNLTQQQTQMSPVTEALRGSDKKFIGVSGSRVNSNEESSVSEQIINGETGPKTSNELSFRKRKAISRGKTKEDGSNSAKGDEGGGDDHANAKRTKTGEGSKNEKRTEEEAKGGPNDEIDKQKTNQKPPEPPKDYIHVRARRGQATDSHSLAERVRREKISERMKLLQDLVPGCNKVIGKALMLDEIINYVQSLQRQVEFLSMKLASVNPGLDFNMESRLLSKDMFQQNTHLPQQTYPLDSSGPALYHHQPPQTLPLSQNPVDPLPLGIQLPSVDRFSDTLPQFSAFSGDDLHSIVQMGFIQNAVNFPENCAVQNQASNMKLEL